MAAAVRLERVCYRYPGSNRVLQEVELSLDAGEYAVVFGANGSGKSSFAYLLNGLIPHFFGGRLQGLVQVGALSTRDCATADLFHKVGLVLQNPDAQLFSSTVADELSFGLESLGLPAPRIEERILATVAALGIETLLGRSPETLSGGEQRLVAISAVLAMGPEVLVLDEPTVSQDAAGKEALAAGIRELAGLGIAVLVATHDLDFAAACAVRWVLLDEGRVRSDGTAADITPLMGAETPEPSNPSTGGKTIASRPVRSGLGPLTMLVLLFAGVGAVLASHSTGTLAAEAAGVAVLLLSSRERQVRSLRLMGPMVALVFVLGIVFIDFETALSLTLRVFSLLGISAVCFASLHPEEVGASLAQLKIPPGPAFMLTAGLRYVPLIEQKIRSIRDAQQARGIDLRPRLANAGNWMALLLPLLVQCFLLADELALAMEARGFSCKRRTLRRPARLGFQDWAVMAAAFCALLLLVYWERG